RMSEIGMRNMIQKFHIKKKKKVRIGTLLNLLACYKITFYNFIGLRARLCIMIGWPFFIQKSGSPIKFVCTQPRRG
ncbi:MAG: hypothetical protein JSV88_25995, partial [Candidatus Aminicenantes bacterium]